MCGSGGFIAVFTKARYSILSLATLIRTLMVLSRVVHSLIFLLINVNVTVRMTALQVFIFWRRGSFGSILLPESGCHDWRFHGFLQFAPGHFLNIMVKVKQSRYRPEQAERVDRGIALPFRDLCTRRGGWSASRPGRFTPEKDPVPVVQEAGWAPGPVWT
jgi:hypothetical protein